MRTFFRRNWGLTILFVFCAFALLRAVFFEAVPGHYRNHTEAGHAMWLGEQVYGVPFAGNYFFYSPSCALFLFGPLSFLPEKLGLFLYLAGSSLLFFWGTARLAAKYLDQRQIQWLWVLIAPSFLSSLGAHKPEILSLGALMLAASWLIVGKRPILGPFLLAMVVNIKLQPLPAVGLLALTVLSFRKNKNAWRWLTTLCASLIFWFTVPFLVRPTSYLLHEHQIWASSLGSFSADAFSGFENIFSTIQFIMGGALTYNGARILSATAAGLLVVYFLIRNRKPTDFPLSVLAALVLGFAYTLIFSPLQQVNAYILITPVFLGCLAAYASSVGTPRKRWTLFLALTWGIFTFGYSDLMPLALRTHLRHLTVRPLAVLALVIPFAYWFNRRQSPT